MRITKYLNSESLGTGALQLFQHIFFNSDLVLSQAIPFRRHFTPLLFLPHQLWTPLRARLTDSNHWMMGARTRTERQVPGDNTTTSDLICPTQKLQRRFYLLVNCLFLQRHFHVSEQCQLPGEFTSPLDLLPFPFCLDICPLFANSEKSCPYHFIFFSNSWLELQLPRWDNKGQFILLPEIITRENR